MPDAALRQHTHMDELSGGHWAGFRAANESGLRVLSIRAASKDADGNAAVTKGRMKRPCSQLSLRPNRYDQT